MPATESLTIEIQGDSSGLSQALDDALARVESLQSAAESASSSAAGIGGRLASVSTALQPLQLVSQQLTRISQQASALAQQPISLNVQPALSALQSLMAAIQAVAAQLRTLSLPGPGRGPIGPGGPSPGTSPRPSPSSGTSAQSAPASYALGAAAMAAPSGLANPMSGRGTSPVGPAGPSPGISPNQLLMMGAAPREALSESRVFAHVRGTTGDESPPQTPSRHHGISDPTQLPIRTREPSSASHLSQSTPLDSRGTPRTSSSFSTSADSTPQSPALDNSSSTVNHFGGITIEVRETAAVNALMRDLRLQGLATRHRQG